MALRISDLGGADRLSEGQLSLCRRASALECELERMEAGMSAGEDVDLKTFATAVGTLSRVLREIGLERVAREARAPTIAELIAEHAL